MYTITTPQGIFLAIDFITYESAYKYYRENRCLYVERKNSVHGNYYTVIVKVAKRKSLS